jgi:hypothetical protein
MNLPNLSVSLIADLDNESCALYSARQLSRSACCVITACCVNKSWDIFSQPHSAPQHKQQI